MAEHDALFRRIFSVPKHAAGELRTMLPPALVARLDLSRLEVVEGTFVSRDLRLRHTDVLFRVPLREPHNGQRFVYIYVLIEHQSHADPDMAFRILEYVVRIWAKLRALQGGRGRLPLVVPLVVHHGARAWSASRSVHDMVEGLSQHPELAAFVPNLELLIDDLSVATDEELLARPLTPVAQVAVWLLRDGRDVKTILAHLETWAHRLAFIATQQSGEIEPLLRYILLAAGEESLDHVRRSILLHVPIAEAPLASVGEQLIQQGFQQGIREGVQQGIREGVQQGIREGVQQGELATLRDTLRVLVESRFGALDETQQACIDSAKAPVLRAMLVRVTSAGSAHEVLSAG